MTDPDRLAHLYACWLSDQIDPADWVRLLREEPGLAEYVASLTPPIDPDTPT